MLPTVGVFKLPLVITLLLLRREMNTYTPIEMPGLLARAQQGGERGQESSWVTGLGSETCLPCTQGCTKADFPCGYPSWAPESRWVKGSLRQTKLSIGKQHPTCGPQHKVGIEIQVWERHRTSQIPRWPRGVETEPLPVPSCLKRPGWLQVKSKVEGKAR